MADSSKARITLDNERIIGEVSPKLFGGFAEHMGRCVYGGLYDPGSSQADERGFRKDVQEALRQMRISVLRYPGGNMLSGYDWRDGVGPKEQRPRRRELAWQSIETNQFGTNEFIEYCRATGIEPMLGTNFGTGTIADSAALVEYCNAPVGTKYSDMRAAHGYKEPHNVKYWCVGNEMDGPWQIGHLEAYDYGRKALEAAKMMRWQDPNVQLVLCGSSTPTMPTFPEWDRVVLETAWEKVDYLALHDYATNYEDDTNSFLALSARFEAYLDDVAGLLRFVKAKLRSKHDVYLSWDEWNVWYKDRSGQGGWKEAPPLSEEVYNLEDALVVAQWMNVFLRRCNILKIACLAQVVNTISPLTVKGDQLLRQTTFYPFVMISNNAAGVSIDPLVKAPQYDTKAFSAMPLLDVSATYDEENNRGAVFIVNRSQTESIVTDINWHGAAPSKANSITQISGNDPKAINSFENPNTIVPQQVSPEAIENGKLTVKLPPLSFTTITLGDYK
jgi:alpha-N-arabinofuranosidase